MGSIIDQLLDGIVVQCVASDPLTRATLALFVEWHGTPSWAECIILEETTGGTAMERARRIILPALVIALVAPVAACGRQGETEREFVHVEAKDEAASERDTPLTDEECAKIAACVGLTADEARDVAQGLGCEVTFTDPYGSYLTEETDPSGGVDEACKATVTDYRLNNYTWFTPEVYFTLSYVDPINSDEEPNRRVIEGFQQGGPLDALNAMWDMGHAYTFEDSDGEDITDAVDRANDGGPIASSTIESAWDERGLFGGYTAHFRVSYSDKEWLDSLSDRNVREVCEEYELQSSGRYYLVPYPERMHQEEPTKDSVDDSAVVMDATRTKNGLQLRVTQPGYPEMEEALAKRLPRNKAEKAAKKYVDKTCDMDRVKISCAEALDEETWLFSGTCDWPSGNVDISDAECEFTVEVTGTKSKPVAGNFDYVVTSDFELYDDFDW